MTENDEKHLDKDETLVEKYPNWVLSLLMVIVNVMISFVMFLPAGDWTWINGWIFVISFAIIYAWEIILLNNKNPEIIKNRFDSKKQMMSEKKSKKEKSKGEKAASSDKIILPIFGIFFYLLFFMPGLDHRNDWSPDLHYIFIIIGLILLAISQYVLYKVMVVNAFASKVLDVREGQKVVDTGAYAYVRHPMYSGFAIMAISIPLILDSLLSFIPAILSLIMLGLRIKYEEIMLEEELEGYSEYKIKVKYKLIPMLY